jgi:hypothetical protein
MVFLGGRYYSGFDSTARLSSRPELLEAELIFTALAELSARQIAQSVDATGMDCLAGYWCCENEITRVVLQSYFTN